MPTSSQALILRNIDSSSTVSHGSFQLGSRCNMMQPALVKSVDINKLFNDMWEEQEMKSLEAYMHGNENEVRSRLGKILKAKGFHTLLSYNPIKDSLQWNFHKELKESVEKLRPKTAKATTIENRQLLEETRSKSVADNLHRRQVSFLEQAKSTPDFPVPERIRSLGFRDPHMAKKSKSPNSPNVRRRNTTENDENSTEAVVQCIDLHQLLQGLQEKECKTTIREDNPDKMEEWKSTKYEERCYPAVHQCKILPQKRPNTLCFSLPENEKYSHEDVKDMLESEFSCNIKTLQFDPLSVRAGDTIVRNRWLVTVESRSEVDQMVRNGFKLDNVKIVIKTLDEVLLREHNAYRYLEKITQRKMTYDNLPYNKHKTTAHRFKPK